MGPVVAPAGTATVIVDVVEVCTVAVTPLNFTRFSLGDVLKLFPLMVTSAPTAPEDGVKPESDGVPVMVTAGPWMVMHFD